MIDENPYRSPVERGAVPVQPSAALLLKAIRALLTLFASAFGLLLGWVAAEIARELIFFPGMRGRPDGTLKLLGSVAGFSSLACFTSAICWILRRDKLGAILFAIGLLCPMFAAFFL